MTLDAWTADACAALSCFEVCCVRCQHSHQLAYAAWLHVVSSSMAVALG